MLAINVSQLLKEPMGASRNLEVADNVSIMDSAGTVTGSAELVRTDRGILVRGRLEVVIEATCCRCLEPFSCSLTIKIEEEYLPSIDITSGLKLAVADEGDSFAIDERHILDLTEAIRQYAILAIPMKLLCRQDCSGVKTTP